MTQVIGDLKKNVLVNFDRFPNSELRQYLNLFIELGWCSQQDTELKTYESVALIFHTIHDDIENIITDIINSSKNFKRFLLMHSIFNIENRDWFEELMLKLLQPTKSDFEWFYNEPEVPANILDKLKLFDPISIGIEKDNIAVSYKLWGKFKDGEQYEPVQLIDFDWSKIEKEQQIRRDILNNSATVDCVKEVDDDLPF